MGAEMCDSSTRETADAVRHSFNNNIKTKQKKDQVLVKRLTLNPGIMNL